MYVQYDVYGHFILIIASRFSIRESYHLLLCYEQHKTDNFKQNTNKLETGKFICVSHFLHKEYTTTEIIWIRSKYSCPSVIRNPVIRNPVIRIPVQSGQFWAKYSAVLSIEIIIKLLLLLLLSLLLSTYTVTYRTSALALRDDFLYVTYTAESPAGGPFYRVIWATSPTHTVQMTEGLLELRLTLTLHLQQTNIKFTRNYLLTQGTYWNRRKSELTYVMNGKCINNEY